MNHKFKRYNSFIMSGYYDYYECENCNIIQCTDKETKNILNWYKVVPNATHPTFAKGLPLLEVVIKPLSCADQLIQNILE